MADEGFSSEGAGQAERNPADARGAGLPAWRPTCLLITCEHGGRRIPRPYRPLFAGAQEALRSHRGWDPGALTLARRLADALAAPLVFSTTSRLLVELNRSEDHPELFSRFTSGLTDAEKEAILARGYHPYRASVRRTISHAIGAGERVLHLSVHSFTPRLADEVRTVEVGVLFDPARSSEAALATWWLDRLRCRGLDARPNEPYKGTDDGLTTSLRAHFPPEAYSGLEVEVRNDLLAGPAAKTIAAGLAADVRLLLGPAEAW